ncbi:hypothetical protein VNO77_04418 [Canavalia gladiata]|uniref:Uncharacterized protein n=1 Tax=Canavalia gladiata TaxID=3824 RepID=A0AAN9N1L0_CANGL
MRERPRRRVQNQNCEEAPGIFITNSREDASTIERRRRRENERARTNEANLSFLLSTTHKSKPLEESFPSLPAKNVTRVVENLLGAFARIIRAPNH